MIGSGVYGRTSQSVGAEGRSGAALGAGRLNALLVVALATDLLTPFLIWKGVLPDFARWLSHAAIVAMIADAYMRMMLTDRVPRVAWLVVWISAVGVVVARFQGQGIAATGWGWWVMFQFPLVGLYTLLLPRWPERFPERLERALIAVLAFEVLVQLGQYATGETPGDNLAGTFGRNGTPDLLMFSSLVIAIALGRWLADGRWRPLALALGLGMVASVLGEIKAFIPVVIALGAMAMAAFAFRRGQLGRLLAYVALFGAVTLGFVRVYDAVVSEPRGTRPIADYLQLDTLDNYLTRSDRSVIDGRYHFELGRNYAVAYGWGQISRDVTTLLFGMGLGARGESRSLGTAGAGLLEGSTGLTSGTSLLVLLQELGVVGLGLLFGFLGWVAWKLWRDVRRLPGSDATALRYGLLFYTALWPVWLWYTSAWMVRVAGVLYWGALGYVVARSWAEAPVVERARGRAATGRLPESARGLGAAGD